MAEQPRKPRKQRDATLKKLDPTKKPVAKSQTSTMRNPNGVLAGPIHRSEQDQAALDTIHKRVGQVIAQQGGNKVLVICPDPDIIRAFKHMNPQASRFIFACDDAETIRKHPRAEVMVLGPFWAHSHWDSMYREIRQKTAIAPHIRVHWFPF